MDERRKEMEEKPKLPAPRPRRSGHIVRSRHAWPPKSPSTDSTTSLAQLHDKLSALPALKYNKVPLKISVTPELPMVREVSEYDDLNSTLNRTNRFGVARRCQSDCETKTPPAKKRPSGFQTSCRVKTSISKSSLETHQSENESLTKRRVQKYQSEFEDKTDEKSFRTHQSNTEVKTVIKKSRCISPINNKQSPSLMLVAALGTSDESVINDTFEKLYKDNPEYDLLDLLVKEAIQNDQEKDSGVCSKITQASDVVENTPVEKIVQKRKLTTNKTINKPKPSIVSNSTTDESNTDAIEDTPCYVFDRKRNVKTYIKETHNTISEEIVSFDADIVDNFFSQHINENNGNITVSPTLARKINETSSEASEGDYADSVICYNEHNNNKFVFDEDIVDCLNSIVDRVCSDFDKCTDLVNEHERQIDNLNIEKIFDDVVCQEESDKENRRTTVTPRTKKQLSLVDDSDDSKKVADNRKKITLKFNFSKKRPSKMNTKQKKGKNIKEVKKVEEDNALIENISNNSPVNTTKALLIRKKRKLYSPKDDDNDDNEIPRSKTESRQSNINKTPLAACYKELEKARKSRIRLPRKSRVGADPLLSPKTRKLNDLFDKIRENVREDEKIKIAKTSSKKKDLSLYNLSSESDDQDFKEKKVKVQKRVSSSSLESSATKRGRLVKLVNYSEVDSCLAYSSENESKKAKKNKTTKQSKPRSRNVKIERDINLIDERMREEQPETLDTSFIKETVKAEKPKELEPALQQAPVLEIITDNLSDIMTENIEPEIKTRTSNKHEIVKIKNEKGTNQRNEKITKSLVTKKSKGTLKQEVNINDSKEPESATVSPLPGLIVETEQTNKDDLTSSLEANLLQKLKNIYTDVQDPIEIDVSQNLLLSGDNGSNRENVSPAKQIETLEVSDSEISIATGGRSPITGHNDLDEAPPQVEMLHENFQHRDLEIHDMSREMVEFLANMRNQLHCSNAAPERTSPVLHMTRNSTKGSIRKQSTTSAKSSNSVPIVVLKRMSSEEIESNLNPIATQSQTPKRSSPKVVLNRDSSEEVAKYLTPCTKKSSSTESPQVVLNRMSSDELNKWLPIPEIKYKDALDEMPKKYNTREKTMKLTGVQKATPEKKIEKKFKSLISPVKLNFDLTDRGIVNRSKTRSSTKSPKSNATKLDRNKEKAIISLSQKSSKTQSTEKQIDSKISKQKKRKEIDTDINKNEVQSTTDTKDKVKTQVLAAESEKITNSPENSKSIASVQDWFQRNVTSSTGRADTTAMKDILTKVREALETTLAEIHQSTGENLTHMFLENQRDLKALEEDLHKLDHDFNGPPAILTSEWRVDLLLAIVLFGKRRVQELEMKFKERACEILRKDAEKKSLLVDLLKDDVQATLDLIDRSDK